ncbi:SapC family protein [Desulfuromonas thiophila]|uniref:SapC protein n=1 Tax=Desulfuromonas thiophila TaxID=57664 RepID=A0A1G7C1Y2_9BACT|nr:SapC family protein [Desulfuromonas thiophila]SDE32770.1 SapC protein [Desulfuromonas thiophila]
MATIHPLSFERHGGKQLLPLSSWAFARQQHLVPLVPAEFPQAAQSFPIVFVRTNKEAGVAAFGLLGLEAGKNLLLNDKNAWLVPYIPAVFRRYPFVLAQTEDKADGQQQFLLCIDESSGLLADSGGAPLFDAEGKRSELIEKTLNFSMEYQKQVTVGQAFCALLEELELLSEIPLQAEQGGKRVRIEGLLQVDEKKLAQLADSAFLRLRQQGTLALVYAHLLSLNKLPLLQQRQRQQQPAAVPDLDKLPEHFSF